MSSDREGTPQVRAARRFGPPSGDRCPLIALISITKQSGGGRLFGRFEWTLGDRQERVARSIYQTALDQFLTELQSRTRRGGRRTNDLGQSFHSDVRRLFPGNDKAVVVSDERKDAFKIESIRLHAITSRFIQQALPLGGWSAHGELHKRRAFPHQSRRIRWRLCKRSFGGRETLVRITGSAFGLRQ